MEALIEREWLQAGHPFFLRHKKFCFAPPSSKNKIVAPTFLLFLDCICQIHCQFPCSFEFNQNFLISLFEHSYSSQFGKSFVFDYFQLQKDKYFKIFS